jgi:drug/metabolite transporter (DMT)-like permease
MLAHWHAGGLDLTALGNEPLLLVGQLAASTVMFLTFFRLQQAGGPTYLSQIGYVAAAVGLLAGVVALGETYPWTVWAGAATIATGIALSTWSQRAR